MSKILIEDIVANLGLHPDTLDCHQLRKFYIVIFWCETLEKFKLGTEKLTDNQEINLSDKITDILSNDSFDTLAQPKLKYDDYDRCFERLCIEHFSISANDFFAESDVPFESNYYNTKLLNSGLEYTNYLTYNYTLNEVQLEAILLANRQLKELANDLFDNPINLKIEFTDNTLQIKSLSELYFKTTKYDDHNQNVLKFISSLLVELQNLKETHNIKVLPTQLLQICRNLNSWIGSSSEARAVPLLHLESIIFSLKSLIIGTRSNPTLNHEILKVICQITQSRPEIRKWNTIDEESQPVDRVLLFSELDILDWEVNDTIELMYQKHPKEIIIATTDPDDVLKVNERNKRLGGKNFKLQTIGHGIPDSDESDFFANLGPFRDQAEISGRKVADLVNICRLINHVKLSCCFGGMMKEGFDIKKHMLEKPSDVIPEMKTLTYIQSDNLTPNLPFFNKTAAISCWNHIDKKHREISLTVSPGIIEPDKALGHMVWRPTPMANGINDFIKEIHITTPHGPKAKNADQSAGAKSRNSL